jgi:rhamnose utilization protein RhaD (predicted bifunctional aldolase and dehydrogenase)/NAD(P)-dependent dehydrogenase (short-subunit alcohol dehydrogenase family)
VSPGATKHETNGGAAGATNAAGPLDAIVELSHRFGTDPEFTRAGGGNSSAKVDGVLYIKASGTQLATLTKETLIGLRMASLLERLDAPNVGGAEAGRDDVMDAALDARIGRDDGRRPSVELMFHALLSQRYVLHTHSIIVNAVTCAGRGAALTAELFGERVLWIPYTDPGMPLARRIRDLWRARTAVAATAAPGEPAILFLQNHGLVVAADTVEEIDHLTAWVVATIQERLGPEPPSRPEPPARPSRLEPAAVSAAVRVIGPVLRAALATGPRLKVVTFDDSAFSTQLIADGPLTPDQIVYAGLSPLVLDPLPTDFDAAALEGQVVAAVEAFEAARGYKPNVVVTPNLGCFAAGSSIEASETVRDVYLDSVKVASLAVRLGGVRPMSEPERGFIEKWEAEEYRRRVAAGSARSGRVEGLIAVVTGAAQGFGLEIASDLVAQGAHVALADLNAPLAEAEANGLAERHGAGRAFGLALDVTDDASVAACFDAVVRRFGGFDLIVSNAGILKAGSVTTQPVGEFDAVTRVNYRGYFLCVRNGAPVLARQHRARPAYWGDVIEINSKSGLAGSSRNSAYAGSKFGGIGLTQSFALELVGDGIKVNAICPGNFLDGPLWSDPNNGLFVQYLREGKVRGAKTIEEVRHAYEAKVPMGRGCEPADVMEALYYVIAQRYETGQAIPVTGGQVMLS